jgi:IS5 family transposase
MSILHNCLIIKKDGILKRDRRSSIEPVIGHAKTECRLNRNHLKGQEGDRMNAILVGCGYNLRRLLRHLFYWLESVALILQRMRSHPQLAMA